MGLCVGALLFARGPSPLSRGYVGRPPMVLRMEALLFARKLTALSRKYVHRPPMVLRLGAGAFRRGVANLFGTRTQAAPVGDMPPWGIRSRVMPQWRQRGFISESQFSPNSINLATRAK